MYRRGRPERPNIQTRQGRSGPISKTVTRIETWSREKLKIYILHDFNDIAYQQLKIRHCFFDGQLNG